MRDYDVREMFLQRLRGKPILEIKPLLRLEDDEELIALRNACRSEGDEVILAMINGLLPNPSNQSGGTPCDS